MTSNSLIIKILPARADNYIFLIHDPTSKSSVVVDPCEAESVNKYLEDQQWTLEAIWNTHHHHDHVGGNLSLQKKHGCKIIGSKSDSKRIPGITDEMSGGDEFNFQDYTVKMIETPGHTLGAISFWIPSQNLLFCGDTLFAMGCGRLFEGTPKMMWDSLEKIKQLPKQTRVYCAHEYTLANARFAKTIDPTNKILDKRIKDMQELRHKGLATIPFHLADDLKTNPFLRTDDHMIRKHLNLHAASDWDVFAKIRSLKDNF